jgi:hypothetical protein
MLFIDFEKMYDSGETYDTILSLKLVRLIKMYLNEAYSKVRIGRNLSDVFPIHSGLKQGDASSPLILNFVLEYAIRKFQEYQKGLELNRTHQLLIYADSVSILGENINTVKGRTLAFLESCREFGMEVNTDKMEHIIMSFHQNAQLMLTANKIKMFGNSSNI